MKTMIFIIVYLILGVLSFWPYICIDRKKRGYLKSADRFINENGVEFIMLIFLWPCWFLGLGAIFIATKLIRIFVNIEWKRVIAEHRKKYPEG